jgi:hypothetical protein
MNNWLMIASSPLKNMYWMKKLFISCIICVICFGIGNLYAQQTKTLTLASSAVKLIFQEQANGWHVQSITIGSKTVPHPSGAYTLLYLNRNPAPNLVELDIEGKDFSFYPAKARTLADGSLEFSQQLRFGEMTARWKINPANPSDIHVEMNVKAIAKGYYSIASPTLAIVEDDELSWGMIPGNWYGRSVEKDFQLATRYSQGVPAVPVLAREKNTMTLCPLITTKEQFTLAVIPDPGTAQDPWGLDSNSRAFNRLGMSLRNRHNQMTPVAYSPVLGQAGSYLKVGESTHFNFSYTLQHADWFSVFRHAVMDLYHYPDLLQTQQNKRSLSERLGLMQVYLRDKKKSAWKTWTSQGYVIGANGAKNADIGAMWMIANAGQDTVLQARLPFVRTHKLAMQEMSPGFFKGASMGEYADADGVESERGNYVEPLFTTYYTLMDMGNMLLYTPNDQELKSRVALAADKLIDWQHADGGWDVAYDRFSHQLSFPDLKDLRPTWYGLFIAYKTLGDEKYLKAAKKGADWLIKNGVDKGYYLGVCGDARNIWDFATAQCAQSFLDLYDLTKEESYKKAAISAAQVYATSIFTQPIATNTIKKVKGKERQDWEITQTGLSVEHIRGTASGGPILISSFAGLFVRIYQLTNEELFLTMARGAARGRDAFVDPENGQSIYYWSGLDNVVNQAKVFPHHAYWQIGWITDYLLSEIKLRSNGAVSFPSGFMTPKVGPHVAYGFSTAKIFNNEAKLFIPAGLLKTDNPNLEYVTALSNQKDKLYVMVLNQGTTAQTGKLKLNLELIEPGHKIQWSAEKVLQGGKISSVNRKTGAIELTIPAWGLQVLVLNLKKG